MTILKKAIRHFYFPLVIVVAVTAHLLLQSRFKEKNLPLLSGLILVAMMPLFIWVEYILPHRRSWLKGNGDTLSDFLNTNVLLGLFTNLSQVAVKGLVFFLAIRLPMKSLWDIWPTQWPILAQLPLAVLSTEFCFYWSHRMFHRVPFLWKLHSIHHGSGRLYWMNSGRFHPIEVFLNTCIFLAPLYILGVPAPVQALFFTFQGAHGFLEHTNVDYELGFLNWVFNSAQLHRWHHSVVIKESNNNFAKTLIVWDVLFGTRFLPEGEVDVIGVEGGLPVPNGLLYQMVYPFKGP